MDQLVLTAKALADATRVRILAALRDGELCVCELGDALGITQSTLSTHLQVIREAGCVHTRRKGKWIYYSLEPAASGLLENVFGHFRDELEKHRLLRRDAARLAKRLTRSSDDTCCRADARALRIAARGKNLGVKPPPGSRAAGIPARRRTTGIS